MQTNSSIKITSQNIGGRIIERSLHCIYVKKKGEYIIIYILKKAKMTKVNVSITYRDSEIDLEVLYIIFCRDCHAPTTTLLKQWYSVDCVQFFQSTSIFVSFGDNMNHFGPNSDITTAHKLVWICTTLR